MELLELLRQETVRAQEDFDLPDFLAAKIFTIIDQPHRYEQRAEEIRALIEQVRLYDTYGQTGYIGMGVNNVILEGTLKRLLTDPQE
ncbi:MAG: hypothetical protein IH614_19305 [Desulfuromonadales bacterium]|nr:hypothetical protein [Desulfuromonadales bacterium]